MNNISFYPSTCCDDVFSCAEILDQHTISGICIDYMYGKSVLNLDDKKHSIIKSHIDKNNIKVTLIDVTFDLSDSNIRKISNISLYYKAPVVLRLNKNQYNETQINKLIKNNVKILMVPNSTWKPSEFILKIKKHVGINIMYDPTCFGNKSIDDYIEYWVLLKPLITHMVVDDFHNGKPAYIGTGSVGIDLLLSKVDKNVHLCLKESKKHKEPIQHSMKYITEMLNNTNNYKYLMR